MKPLATKPTLRSLRRKLLLPLALVGSIVTVLAIGSVYAQSKAELEGMLGKRAELLANMVNYAAESTYRPGELQRIVSAIGADSDVLEIVVVGGTPTQVLVTTRNAWARKPLEQLPGEEVGDDLIKAIQSGAAHHHMNSREQLFDYSAPFRIRDPAIPEGPLTEGAIMVHLDTRPMWAAIWQSTIIFSGIFLVGLAILAVLAVVLFNTKVLHPIKLIGEAVQGGHLETDDSWSSIAADDEIGILAFTLRESLSQTQDALREKDGLLTEIQKVLRENKALMSTVNMHAIVSVTNRRGRIIEVNDAFCQISGYSREELIGQNHRILNSGAKSPAFWVDMWQQISSGKPWRGELRNRAKDGSYYWVNTIIAPFMGADGKVDRYVSIRTDITEAKQASLMMEKATEAAQEASRSKSQFLANMSHEIRTPMNAILGMIALLRKTGLTERQDDYAGKSEGAARSLLGLLNDILDISKVEAGKMDLDPQPFRFDQMLHDLSVIFSASVGKKAIEVLFDIDPALPRHLVGDAMRLKQVLINLGGNAIKFTERGEVLLSVEVLKRDETTVTLRITMSDTGIGIAPENQERIFSSFTQAEASTTRRFGGTGLGVAISHRLVALMGGELEVQSTLGEGSRFHFSITLPLAPAIEHEEILERLAVASPAESWRVLVVDDNPTACEVLERMSKSLGWMVDVASGGEQALELMQERSAAGVGYQSVFVDWNMPGLDGWQTCQRIRDLGLAGGAPVMVMVTAYGREMLSQRSEADQALLDGFLVKPVTASMLFDAVVTARSDTHQSHPSKQAVSAVRRRLAGMRLLVVEDNINNQQVARELLEDEGAAVQIADNGQLAIEAVAAAEPPFDVVLMDLQMPVMDGFTATRHIREELKILTLPIVAMTANAMSSDRDACLAAGMNDHVGKPFDLNHLVSVLLKHAGRQVIQLAEQEAAAKVEFDLHATVGEAAANAGVQLGAALSRLGGKSDIYQRTLRAFLAELESLPGQLRAYLENADERSAVRLVHTIRGSAATLGVSELATEAALCENQLIGADPAKTADAEQRICAAAAAFSPGLVTLLEALQATDKPEAPSGAQIDPQAMRSALRSLASLLRDSDMAATETMGIVQRDFGAASGGALEPLRNAVDSLDFERALRLCNELIEDETA